jgi:hypothetical protein
VLRFAQRQADGAFRRIGRNAGIQTAQAFERIRLQQASLGFTRRVRAENVDYSGTSDAICRCAGHPRLNSDSPAVIGLGHRRDERTAPAHRCRVATLLAMTVFAMVVAWWGWQAFGPAPVRILPAAPADPAATILASGLLVAPGAALQRQHSSRTRPRSVAIPACSVSWRSMMDAVMRCFACLPGRAWSHRDRRSRKVRRLPRYARTA